MNAHTAAATTMTSLVAREAATDSLIGIISHAISMFTDGKRARQTRNDLRKLDDHMLRDIGLTRYDVEFGDLGLARLSRLSAKGHPENL